MKKNDAIKEIKLDELKNVSGGNGGGYIPPRRGRYSR